MIDYALILRKKYTAEWSLEGTDYQGLTWLSDTPKPSKKELDDQWQEVKSMKDAEIQAKLDAKANAEAKLAALGLTPDDLKALGL
jgi:hypothetical protein